MKPNASESLNMSSGINDTEYDWITKMGNLIEPMESIRYYQATW